MTQHAAEIEAIAGNAEAPTFANTIEALDRSGDLLSRVSIVFFNVKEAHTNDSLNAIAEEVAPKLSQHHDAILLNETLFTRVKAVYENRDSLTLTPEQMRLVTETYKGFVRGGANLPAEKKEELKKINEQLALLDLKFDKNLLAETNGFKLVLEDKADLAGLPENVVAGAAEEAKAAGMEGKWVFTLQKPSWIPFLTYSDKRELREKLYKAMYNRANNDNENDNKEVIRQYLKLRLQKANLMGYPNWASFVVDDNMAKTPENVYNLLTQVWTPAIARAKEEAADIQAMIDREGGNFKLESWDWWYYAEKVRKEKFNLDEEQLRPYFELNNVRDGVFGVANKLYGLTFTKMENMPLFHPECEVYEVKDGDGSFIGVLYMDYFPRASKKGGAWMTNYREQYTSPDMEHWVDQPEVLKMYARHYQTGEVIPQELIDKLDKAGKFNQGFATSEFIAAALLDMDYHTLTNADNIDVNAFEQKAMEKIGLISQIIPRYRSTYFAHIFSWGYSSGYYAYTWSEVLDADAFEAFKEAGNIFDPAVAKAFRSNILEKGGTEDPMKLYLQFRGKEPNIQPLLKNRGLN